MFSARALIEGLAISITLVCKPWLSSAVLLSFVAAAVSTGKMQKKASPSADGPVCSYAMPGEEAIEAKDVLQMPIAQ